MANINYKKYLNNYITNLATTSTIDHKFSLFIILGLGLFLRLYSLYVGEAFHVFSINDDIVVLNSVLALSSLEGSSWYLGPSLFSGGNAAGPLWTLFILIIYKLGFSSITGALFIMALLSMMSIYLLYRIALLFFPPQYALFTALLFSTAPWAVYYSVGFYCPMPTIFLGELLFLALWKTLTVPNSKSIIFVCLLSAMLPQFHMITIFFFPAILLLLWMSDARLSSRFLISGAIIGFLFYLPYLIGDSLNGWENTKIILSGAEKPFTYSTFKVLTAPVTVLSNAPTDWIGREADGFAGYKNFGNQYFYHYSVLLGINLINLLILFFLFFRFIGISGLYIWTHKTKPKALINNNIKLTFLALLIILPLILFVITGKNYSTRYTLIMLSLLFVMQVFVILNFKSSKLIKGMTIYFLVTILFSIYILISHYNYKSILINTSETFLPSFSKLENIKSAIYSKIPKDTHVKIILSETINNMPESKRKLYSALNEFMALDLREYAGSSSTTQEVFVVTGNESYNNIKYPDILYSSPSIIVLKK